MEIISLRSEFSVYIVESDLSLRNQLVEILSGVRFQTEYFSSAEAALKRIREAPPHIIFTGDELNFVNQVRALSTDIEIVFLTAESRRQMGVESLRHGAYAYIIKPFENPSEIISAADRAMENIYLRMENEQLLQELSKSTPPAPAIAPSDFETFFQRLITLEDPDQIISTLIAEVSRANGNVPTIYLKFLPAYQSLAITASAKIPHDQVFSVGIKLDRHDPREVPEFLENPATFKELHELMREVFHCEGFSALPLRSEGGPQGIIVVFTKNASPSTSAMVVGASLQFNSVVLNSKLKEVTIKDFLTGLYNRRYFMERVDEEVSRCYRTHYPLSFIHLDIDDFNTYSVVNGPIMADIVLKTVSQIISKTGRKIDAAVRWGASEFGVLCPNTPGVGAAIKAEKMRITIESTKFPLSDKQPLGKITISVGVSEYPTLASDSTMLLKSAANALFQVKQGGKNRVCLAEAPSGFKPDFEPLPVPGFKKIQQSLNQTAF